MKGSAGNVGLPSSSLCGQKGASCVDFQPTLPLRWRHIYRVRTPHDASEAAQYIHAAQLRNRKLDRRLQLLHVRDVHFYQEYSGIGEICLERLDLLR